MNGSLLSPQVILAALNAHPEPTCIVDERSRIHFCNKAAGGLLNLAESQVTGKGVYEVFTRFGDSISGKLVSFINLFFLSDSRDMAVKVNLLESESHWRGALEIRIEPIPAQLDASQGQGQMHGALLVLRDVTSQWNLNNELHYQATHDPLTGLLNRREFENRLEEYLQHSKQTSDKHSFCFIDLNNFKRINDNHGHIAGDELLKGLSEHFKAQLRKGDVLGRLGGDEFGLILGSCAGYDALHVVKGIQNNLSNYKFEFNQQAFHISASIGVIDIGKHVKTVKEMIAIADLACYEAKQHKNDDSGVVHVMADFINRNKKSLSA